MNLTLFEILRKRVDLVPCDGAPDEAGVHRAAVALVIDSLTDEDRLLLVKRTARPHDPWSGQMAFPGGRMSHQDKSLLDTVVREVQEETGFNLSDHDIVGTIDDVRSSSQPVVVTPFVVFLRKTVTLTLEEDELASASWVPMKQLSKPTMKHLIVQAERELYAEAIPYNDHFIWGLTLRMIKDLLSRIMPEQST